MGKKRSKPSKKRIVAYTGITAGEVEELTFTVDPRTGEMHCEQLDPKTLCIERSYVKGNGKEKSLLRMPVSKMASEYSVNSDLLRDYDYLVAIDTSTKSVGDVKVSVVVSFVAHLHQGSSAFVPLSPLASFILLNVVDGVNPERVGWHLVLEKHVRQGLQDGTKRIGIAVDSELGLIPKINSGSEPYYSNHTLPSKMQLIYAADAAADSWPNELLRLCDSNAARGLAQIESQLHKIRTMKRGDDNFLGFLELHFDPRQPV